MDLALADINSMNYFIYIKYNSLFWNVAKVFGQISDFKFRNIILLSYYNINIKICSRNLWSQFKRSDLFLWEKRKEKRRGINISNSRYTNLLDCIEKGKDSRDWILQTQIWTYIIPHLVNSQESIKSESTMWWWNTFILVLKIHVHQRLIRSATY